MELVYALVAMAGGYVIVGGAALFVALRKRRPPSELSKQLGPAY